MECTECVKLECINDFKKYSKELISKEGNKPKINWPFYLKFCSEDRNPMAKVLISLGIFSLKSKGNWEIEAVGPIGLNPRVNMGYLYFTRQEDIVEFARLKYSNTLYGWEIRHISEILTKKEILKL
jgi:hypothetical protein